MKRLFLFLILFLTAGVSAQLPTKQFDARNGNGAVLAGTTYADATLIVFKDAAAKTEAIDAVCALGNYDALDPATRPSKQAFYNREITFWLRQKVREHRQNIENAKVVKANEDDLP